ncbi:MAG TPA: ABC transporter ATP-binding protein [Arachnia sp.]|nr:ABC transporter ATP-binding protein [Arachnia sp.]HMT86862.1 ABC transporter ATP-binding protein [Arachnia sp.]
MITARGLSKHYGTKKALDDVSFDIRPGKVTGFLGPNGAGKSTSMRLMVGLDRPTSGEVTIGGMSFVRQAAPLTVVGALLDAKGVHPGRTARSHLRALAATHGLGARRVEQVLEMTGLTEVAGKRVGGFSLGMGQRLGIAAALLGDPQVLILDEPVNGLDPDGVLWVRNLVRSQAAAGKTVLLSSHLMSEMAQTADHIIVLGRGRVIADAPVGELLTAGSPLVRVSTPEGSRLVHVLRSARLSDAELTIDVDQEGVLTVRGAEARQIGRLCAQHGIELHQLTPLTGSLEDAYLALTRDELEYRTAEPAGIAA